MERLLSAWQKRPELRLGQLLVVGVTGRDVFCAEDETLVRCAERLAKEER